MRCIFCLNDREPSCEHVFPAAIGGTLTIDRVCKPCNDRLGAEVDCKLSDHLACIIVREQLGMTDGDGRPVRSWPKIFGEGVLAADPTRVIETHQDRDTGRFTTKLRVHSQKVKGPDGTEHEERSMDLSDIDRIPVLVQRWRKREGLPPLSDQELEILKEEALRNVHTIDQPDVILQTKGLDLEAFNEAYKPAIAKIAYEMGWLWLGDTYLDDPRAAMLRDYIFGRRHDLPNARFEFDEGFAGFAPWAGEPNAHLAIGTSQARSHAIALRIFGIFVAVIEVTAENERYKDSDWNKFLLIDPATGAQRASTLSAELFRIRQLEPRRGRDQPR